MKWTKHDEKNRKQFLSVLLRNVKFERIPKAYIFEILHEPLVKEDPECDFQYNNIFSTYLFYLSCLLNNCYI